MFSFIKRNKETNKKQNSSTDLPDSSEQSNGLEAQNNQANLDSTQSIDSSEATESPQLTESTPEISQKPESEKKGLFGRLKQRLSKTRSSITDGISNAILGKKEIDECTRDAWPTVGL